MQKLKGVGVAMVTPFTETGAIDYLALKNLIELYVEQGIDYLVVLGTTAEVVTLSSEEKETIMRTVVKYNQNRLPLVVGKGGNNTAALVKEIKETDFEGYSAILSVCPYYNKPNQEGIYQHFSAVAAAAPLPVILYNVPSRTAAAIANETTLRLIKAHKNIVGIKDASANMTLNAELINSVPEHFLVLSGDDESALNLCEIGGHGVISVIAGALPKQFSSLIHHGLKGEFTAAKRLQEQIKPMIDLLFEEGNPTGLKALLAHQNRCVNQLRLPLVKASSSLQNRIEKDYSKLV
ncbi:MAG: 4-hydroxy-tetrahydrodipicolinate synthase [Flavobacteriaceae bacterium]